MKRLESALGQYKHNDGSEGFVIAYDKEATEKAFAMNASSEIHRLARIMRREFGDSIGRFVSMYATKLNNDFNNPQK